MMYQKVRKCFRLPYERQKHAWHAFRWRRSDGCRRNEIHGWAGSMLSDPKMTSRPKAEYALIKIGKCFRRKGQKDWSMHLKWRLDSKKTSSIPQANRKIMNPQVLAWHTSNLIMRMLRECFAAWIGMSPPVSVNICTDVPAAVLADCFLVQVLGSVQFWLIPPKR